MSTENNQTSKGNVAQKAAKLDVNALLKSPIVKIVLLAVVVLVLVLLVKGLFKGNNEDTELVGYQKLVNVTDNTYTFIDLEGKVKKYEGYTSMDDFYYDVTCVSKLTGENNNITQMALINKNKGTVVKFGVYDSFIQVVGGKYYKVEKEGKYGVIDHNGKVVINPEYDYISITTVQEATEIVFECQKDNKYYFLNEKGTLLMETESALHSISYSNKFNGEYDTVIYISVDGVKRYFNLETAEEVFAGMENVSFSYNILKTDGKIGFYDKKAKLKSEIDTSADYSSDARVYFKKYVVLEQKNVTTGTREYKYTVYNSDFKQILESTSKINPVQDVDKNVYFIINDNDGVRIINENKKEVKIKGYEFNGNNINNLQNIVLNPIGESSKYEVYNFKGKKVISDVNEYTQKGFGLLIGKYDQTGTLARSLVLEKGKEVALGADDNVLANEYYLTIENGVESKVSVVDRKGNVKLDKVPGVKIFYVENYIGVQDGETVRVYDIEKGKETFTYSVNDYVNRDETVNVIELTTGYYGFNGKTILEKAQ